MSAPANDPHYAMGRSEEETQRLLRQGHLFNPLTRRLFIDAGIGSGMRVLDVGSGAGDVALIVADLVGPTGSVVGVDPDAEILDMARHRVRAAGWPNVTFVAGDVRTEQFDDLFDAVVGRFVLIWVRDQVEVLRACLTHLKPGGIISFQEHDISGYAAFPPSALIAQMNRWADEWQETVAAQVAGERPVARFQSTVNHLFGSFQEAGLATPQMRYEAPIGGGPEWSGYAALTDHLRRFVPMFVEADVATEAEIDIETFEERLRTETVGQQGALRCLPATGIWARKPIPA